MKIYREIDLKDFEFWAGAADTKSWLTEDDFAIIQEVLEECYPEGLSEIAVNDFFWFDTDTIADWLGYADWDALVDAREKAAKTEED